MKTLILLRHGFAQDGATDYDRPLSEGGKSGVLAAATSLLARSSGQPTLVASSAVRTLQTAELVAEVLKTGNVRSVRSLYLAAPPAYRSVVAETPESCQELIVVGHNPGLSELAQELTRTPRSLQPAEYVAYEFSGPWTTLEI